MQSMLLEHAMPVSNLIAVAVGLVTLFCTRASSGGGLPDAALDETRDGVMGGVVAYLVAIGTYWSFELLARLAFGNPDGMPVGLVMVGTMVVIGAGAGVASAALAMVPNKAIREQAAAYANGAYALLTATAVAAAALPAEGPYAGPVLARMLAELFYASMLLTMAGVAYTRDDVASRSRRFCLCAAAIFLAPTVSGWTLTSLYSGRAIMQTVALMPIFTVLWWACVALFLWRGPHPVLWGRGSVGSVLDATLPDRLSEAVPEGRMPEASQQAEKSLR